MPIDLIRAADPSTRSIPCGADQGRSPGGTGVSIDQFRPGEQRIGIASTGPRVQAPSTQAQNTTEINVSVIDISTASPRSKEGLGS